MKSDLKTSIDTILSGQEYNLNDLLQFADRHHGGIGLGTPQSYLQLHHTIYTMEYDSASKWYLIMHAFDLRDDEVTR